MRATPKTVGLSSLLLFALLAAVMVISLNLGAVYISPAAVWKWLTGGNVDISLSVILGSLRTPRILLAALVGASLSICGITFQGVLRNPLAEPFILGVSGGAAAGAVICLMIGMAGLWKIAGAAFVGAMGAVMMVLVISRRQGRMDTTTLILTGVMINAFFTAVIMFMISVATDHKLQAIMFWLYGDFSNATIQQVLLLGPIVLGGGTVLFFLSQRLNLIAAGEQTAAAAGVDVEKTKFLLFLLVSLIGGVTVSLSGLIGFVGLIVPHLVRITLGHDHRMLIPAGGLFGATFLLLADTCARTVIRPSQLPVGVVTAFLGAPFFIMLMTRKGTRWW